MWLSVLGAGEVGLACALALASGASRAQVSLLTRDGVLQEAQESLLRTVWARRGMCKDSAATALPPSLQVRAYTSALPGTQTQPPSSSPSGVLVCSPITSLIPDASAPTTAPGRVGKHTDASHPSATPPPPVVDYLLRHGSPHPGAAGRDVSFVACLTRGFGPDGETATELVQRALASPPGEAGAGSSAPVPVFAVTGPIIAREWLHASASAITQEESGAHGVDPTDSVRQFSGTALTFGLCAEHAPQRCTDSGYLDAMERLFRDTLFPRESVVLERDPTAGAALAVVNGCLPLCAFGAGLVGNVYTGGSVSALAAYAQHCAAATTALVNDLVDGRTPGMPLPMGAYAAIFSACNVFSSKEFVLGRQMDFKFRQMDAVQSVYPGRTHEAFSATVDGLHTRMRARQASSPFYEVLMDTFGTVLRASTSGEGLVKQGHYEYREGRPSPLLAHVVEIDEAMLSGDEARFEEAKRKVEEAFTFYPVKR